MGRESHHARWILELVVRKVQDTDARALKDTSDVISGLSRAREVT